MDNRLHTALSLRNVSLCLALLGCFARIAVAQPSQGLVSCKPLSQKTGELGCWILASQQLGALEGPVYWTLDTFPEKAAAERAKGPGGTVVETLGKAWLFTIGKKLDEGAGTRVTQIGPLPVHAGQRYTAQYMEATLQPGMVSKTHLHSGVEAFYTESGETCLETPEGKQTGRRGSDIIVPEGVPMELTATGAETRKGVILILHDASKPPTTLVEEWKSKKLCGDTASKEVSATPADFIRFQLQWAEARKAQDVAFLERFYATDFSVGNMNGAESSRENDIAMFSSGDLKPAVITDDQMKVTIFGDGALVTGQEHLKGSYKGHTGQFDLQFANTYVLRDGRWQLLRHQATPVAKK